MARGTGSSNPFPSSEESVANLTFGERRGSPAARNSFPIHARGASGDQWIAWNWLGRARDLPGMGGIGRSNQPGHHFDLHVAVLQLPLVALLEQHRADQPNDRSFIGEDGDDVGVALDSLLGRSNGLVQFTAVLLGDGTSVSLSSVKAASFGHFCRYWSATRRSMALAWGPVGRVSLSFMSRFRSRPLASLYVAGPFAMGYTEFYNFLIPLYGLSLGMKASAIGTLVGARSLLAVFLSLHVLALMDLLLTPRVNFFFVRSAVASAPAFPLLP